MGTFNTIPHFKFWCQKVLPLVYDDSLSYYELLCKVINYLNHIIDDVNQIPEIINSLISDEKLEEIMSELLDALREQIARANEGTNTTASYDRDKGELVWLNGKLVVMTRDILAGDRYVEEVDPNDDITGNFVYTSIEIEMNKIKSDLTVALENEISARESADTQISNNLNSEIGNRENADTQILNKLNKRYYTVVTEYGAVGDGVTDDTQAFKNAIDSGYEYIFIPDGNYLITEKIVITKANIKLFGDGVGKSTIFMSNDIEYLFEISTNANNFTMHDISINGDMTNTSEIACILLYDVKDVHLHDIEIKNFYNIGIGCARTTGRINIERCYIHDNVYHSGIATYSSSSVNNNGPIIIRDCTIENIGLDGMSITHAFHVYIENCRVEHVGNREDAACLYLSNNMYHYVVNNILNDATGNGIDLVHDVQTVNGIIHDNEVSNCEGVGILLRNVKDFDVRCNRVYNTGTSGTVNGGACISLLATCYNVELALNDLRTNPNCAVFIESSTSPSIYLLSNTYAVAGDNFRGGTGTYYHTIDSTRVDINQT